MGLITRIKNDVIFATAAIRTLKRLGAVYKNPERTYADVIEDQARDIPDNIAIYFEDVTYSYRDYDAQANRYARWALAQGIGKGHVVALLMENRPEYLFAWLGILKTGAAAALINTNQTKGPLAHSLGISGADHLILGAELAENFASIDANGFDRPLKVWSTGGHVNGAQDLDADLAGQPDEPLPAGLRKGVTIEDNALFIYTSGTTGNPKAAKLPHARVLGIMGAFSAGANATARDRMYCVLPLYHSAGGICAVGTTLTVGGSVIIRRKFSTTEFWNDVNKYGATLFQYIGELCRYLLNSPPHPFETNHSLRLAVGNGLRPEIWPAFQKRFNIPRMLEFYGATEGNVALMNFDGKVGAVGRVPSWARSRFNVELVRFDVDTEQPVRGPDGFCIRCEPGEAGEALGKITVDPNMPTGRFDGYAKKEETEKKILRNAFEKGDAWFRTGDLLKQDKLGYFYFVDRVGDTFRWKGENVSTNEVSEAITVFPGVKEANVYGVHVPGQDGRAGMVAIVADKNFSVENLGPHLQHELPEYAKPLFLRLQPELEITGTFKQRKVDLVSDGFNPTIVKDPLYFNMPGQNHFVPLDETLYNQIISGEIRL
ncbi:MAG: long-chain-acyl-CoA synthetase [Parvibaculaceae bacterium]|nr:long-chain-acyl-CoA synthetase [Parvibaculaceae bacterium]